MNHSMFMDRLAEVLPPGKPLTAAQWSAYREKLQQFDDSQLDKIYESVLENCRFFPKIADLYEAAKNLCFLEKKIEYRPHVWTPTDCTMCGGSGLVASFWSQEFEVTETSKTQILRLHYLQPYHTSAAYHQRTDHDDIRSVHRCSCDCGGVTTLAKGIPRWKPDQSQVIRRNWGIMSKADINRAYSQGRQAYRTGASPSRCVYKDPERDRAWQQGYWYQRLQTNTPTLPQMTALADGYRPKGKP